MQTDTEFDGTAGDHIIAAKPGDPTTILITGGTVAGGTPDITIDLTNLTDAAGDQITFQGTAASIVNAANTFTVKQKTVTGPAIQFNADGVPNAFNIDQLAVLGFTDGAGDMNETDIDSDGIPDIHRISLDFGTVSEATGMTQFGGDFTPTFTQQNGAQFGSFTGLTVAEDGLLTAIDHRRPRPTRPWPSVSALPCPTDRGRRRHERRRER